jgi:hypothetical protein
MVESSYLTVVQMKLDLNMSMITLIIIHICLYNSDIDYNNVKYR